MTGVTPYKRTMAGRHRAEDGIKVAAPAMLRGIPDVLMLTAFIRHSLAQETG
jgi:hypothetical protein